MNTQQPQSPAPIQQLVGRLRELMAKATPAPWYTKKYNALGLEIGGKTRPVIYHSWFGDWPKNKQDDDAAMIVAAINALPALLAIAEAANLALDHMDGNDVPAWLSEAYLALGAALRLPPNAQADGPPQENPNTTTTNPIGGHLHQLVGPALKDTTNV